MNFPFAGEIVRSGVKLSVASVRSVSIPLNTESTTIRAVVPIATPTILMMEMMFMAFCFFLENRYLRAMNIDRFIVDTGYCFNRESILSM